jgi:uncharacterized protein (DUF1330 family)
MKQGWTGIRCGAAALALTMMAVGGAAAATKAYVVNEITVSDPLRFQTYADQAPATLVPFGGKYLVRGKGEAMAGRSPADLIVILEFPDRAQAKAWRASAAYQKILPIRDATSTSRVYVVDGVAP